jgi:hypothetical protein
MKGEVKQLNETDWMKIEYEPLLEAIQIIGPVEVINRIWGATVEVRLEDGTEKAGFTNADGVIVPRSSCGPRTGLFLWVLLDFFQRSAREQSISAPAIGVVERRYVVMNEVVFWGPAFRTGISQAERYPQLN